MAIIFLFLTISCTDVYKSNNSKTIFFKYMLVYTQAVSFKTTEEFERK